MISTTSWILDTYLKAGLYSYYQGLSEWSSEFLAPRPSLPPPESIKPLSSADYNDSIEEQFTQNYQQYNTDYNMPLKMISKPIELIDFVVPRMLAAVDYLATRDIDNDGILEQGYNEDWMDTALRAGKIVYSQACWILALTDFSSLLYEIGEKNMAKKMAAIAERTVYAIEEKLWSEEDSSYIDMKYNHYDESSSYGIENNNNNHHFYTDINNQEKVLTQDVSLYLVSITENTFNDVLSTRFKGSNNKGNIENNTTTSENQITESEMISRHKTTTRPRVPHKTFEFRAASTLEAIKNRTWRNSVWPLITEKELKRTGPLVLEPNQYHNHTFWPWITGIEMLARSRFQRYDECNELLATLTKGKHPETLAFYEWVNPITGKGGGAFPFRTGISAIRIALTDILLSYL